MLFKIIIIVFVLIGYIAVFGDYREKEIQKDYEKFRKMMEENER